MPCILYQLLQRMEDLHARFYLTKSKTLVLLLLLIFLCGLVRHSNAQIANYVSNGSFELTKSATDCSSKDWRDIDSLVSIVIYSNACINNSPYFGFGFQYPRSGKSLVFFDFYLPTSSPYSRTYIRNRLKSTLIKDKIYCVKFYVCNGNNSTHGIDAFEAYFGDNSLDTITYGHVPLTYLTSQVRNPKGNIITDTLNWTLVTGTFVAQGTEKFMVIGNFESDANTDTVFWNPTWSPMIGFSASLDDVSCIPIDLPAYAGPDRRFLPGDTLYLGRTRDVGIDEACIWYKWPNMTTAIDTAAGIFVSPVQTSTYIVRQEICGNVKFDTVVVYQDAVGLEKLEAIEKNISLFPQPSSDYVQLTVGEYAVSELFASYIIYDQNLKIVQQGVISDKVEDVNFDVSKLASGLYSLRLFNREQAWSVSKKLLVAR